MEIKIESIVAEKNIYIAIDGKEFDNKYACKDYEEKLIAKENVKHIKRVTASLFDFEEWWFIENEEDLSNFQEYIKKHHDGSIRFVQGSIIKFDEGGTWISLDIEYNSNDPDDCKIVSLKEIQKEYNNLLCKVGIINSDEKQIAKKTISITHNSPLGRCPTCNNRIPCITALYKTEHCSDCGQKLLWE